VQQKPVFPLGRTQQPPQIGYRPLAGLGALKVRRQAALDSTQVGHSPVDCGDAWVPKESRRFHSTSHRRARPFPQPPELGAGRVSGAIQAVEPARGLPAESPRTGGALRGLTGAGGVFAEAARAASCGCDTSVLTIRIGPLFGPDSEGFDTHNHAYGRRGQCEEVGRRGELAIMQSVADQGGTGVYCQGTNSKVSQ
jgi:hypothetical protein